ncbi:AlwI family type II restriction endonuclease [Taylorella equigenitalis]|uniref:AlwI family type II restriction endonuclease n=1 Tax=Taylorella equigenitalis TaxID=29575 RepID=UPI00040E312A|nr:AlwI family type II restriction endonuclease [Taylorella equigenitalis]ASY38140.1 AlwI family type II restriction endonuclease [Taylorella equigenitalis]KGK34166.1 hypothetical protein LW90_01005 [Taylorella equigenitalis]WDU46030.1 AlwI family type II restriction endonuclease [Taylorella equigenitalis]
MKLESENSVFNLGDTSIRVKKIVEVYKQTLLFLKNFSFVGLGWSDKKFQEEFYKGLLEDFSYKEEYEGLALFDNLSRNYTYPETDKLGQRGRTLTNALLKIGFINKDRQISEVGDNFILENPKNYDQLEMILHGDHNNIIFLRQLLKLRVYSKTKDRYIYIFRIALKLLATYERIERNHFVKIIHSINPDIDELGLEQIINGYDQVVSGKIDFNQYCNDFINKTLISNDELDLVQKILNDNSINFDEFKDFFKNKKSSSTIRLYYDFVTALLRYKKSKTNSNLELLVRFSRDSAIKKAFGFNQIPFDLSDYLNDFEVNNSSNPLLSNDNLDIYRTFKSSKKEDLIKEYSDITFRTFKATGIIGIENGIVILNKRWLFKILIDVLDDKFRMLGSGSIKNYENNLNSEWFKDNTLTEILGVTDEELSEIFSYLTTKFKVDNISELGSYLENKYEREFKVFINEKFPPTKVVEILRDIHERNDQNVYQTVTDNASIPSIYEYILTIAWYYIISDVDYSLSKSFKVTLDGNKLPLCHRGGGVGDIEFKKNNIALLIEATLMGSSTQKRGELEPVIRHSVNFTLENADSKSFTIFVANKIDNNVANIFRAMQFVELTGTNLTRTVSGVNIFCLTTLDLVELITRDIKLNDLIRVFENNLNNQPCRIYSNWMDNIRNSIFELSTNK